MNPDTKDLAERYLEILHEYVGGTSKKLTRVISSMGIRSPKAWPLMITSRHS